MRRYALFNVGAKIPCLVYTSSIKYLGAHRVAVARSLQTERRCRQRLEAMLAQINADVVEFVPDEKLEAILEGLGQREEIRRADLGGRCTRKDLIVFKRSTGAELLPGYTWCEVRDGGRERRLHDVLCHTAVEIQSAVGCPFDRTYCPYTRFMVVRLDVEEFADAVAGMAQAHKRQSLFKLNNRTDTLGLEPHYGLAPRLINRFAQLEGKYLMLYSKGEAVDALVDLDHRKKTVACFTLTPQPVASLVEPGAPPPHRRLVAIGKLAAAGYPIRVRLSPIVPVAGWRTAYKQLIADLAAVAQPEMVTLWTLSMINHEDLHRIIPETALDDSVLAASRAEAKEMHGRKGAPFPPVVRAELYREIAAWTRAHFDQTAISLCLEQDEVWQAAGQDLVPRHGGRFLCNCGPRATPQQVAKVTCSSQSD